MFRASSAHLQEDTVVHMQHMVLSLSMRVFYCMLITNFCALIIIYSLNINLLYMFRASSAHFQEDTVVYMQHMVLSLSLKVPGGL